MKGSASGCGRYMLSDSRQQLAVILYKLTIYSTLITANLLASTILPRNLQARGRTTYDIAKVLATTV